MVMKKWGSSFFAPSRKNRSRPKSKKVVGSIGLTDKMVCLTKGNLQRKRLPRRNLQTSEGACGR